MSLKPFNKLAVRALSSLKHSPAPRVLNLIKHSCPFIKHYILYCIVNNARFLKIVLLFLKSDSCRKENAKVQNHISIVHKA